MSYKFTGTRFILLALAVSLLISGSRTLVAQVTSAAISGTVSDDSGAVLPGVSVMLKQVDTGKLRSVITDDEGRYHAPQLDLGDYEVQAELSGFQTTVRSGITLTLGREAIVDLVLKVGQISEKVVVQGEASLVETTSATVAGLVDEKKIRDLPLNGRGFTNLALLTEGVVSPQAGGTQVGAEGQRVSIGGTRTTQTAFMLDGTDLRNQWGGTPGSAAGVVLGVETVREFTVITGTASAEYGGFSGGVVNAVTRSGTNQFHGSLFEFHRNSALDARNFFDAGSKPPGFVRNQYGFSLGGPIVHDRTFFFGNYEGLRDRLTTTNRSTVPNADAHNGILPAAQGGNIGVNPAVKPYLDTYPLPNGQVFNDGTGELILPNWQPTDQNYYMAKVDHQIGPSDSLFVRYTADKGVRSNAGTFNLFRHPVFSLSQYVTIDERKILSPNLLNALLISFSRTNFHGEVESSIDPSLKFIPLADRTWGSIGVTGISGWGPASNVALNKNVLNRFEYSDTVVYTAGRHTIKTGLRFTRFQFNLINPFRSLGSYNFNSLALFLQGRARQFSGVVTPLVKQGMREYMTGLFVQDDFKVRPNLTLNLGLRYELTSDVSEVNGRVSNLDSVYDSQLRVGNPWLKRPSAKNFAPRIGFAWDPSNDGKMSVRGGFGIFYDLILPPVYQAAPQYNPPSIQATLQSSTDNVPFPNAYYTVGDLSNAALAVWVIPKADQAYVMQYSLNVQREILPSTVVSIGYSGSRGVHLNRLVDANIAIPQIVNGRYFYPENSTRRNPRFGQMRASYFEANSFYNAFRLSINRRFRNGFQAQSNYSFSRSTDDASNTGPIDTTAGGNGVDNMPFDHRYNHGLSGFDIRHVYVFNATMELPFGAGKKWGANLGGFASKLLSGWQANGIVNLTTGTPQNITVGFERSRSRATVDVVERPDLKPGASNNPILNDGREPTRYYDPNAFSLPVAGFYGNLGSRTVTRAGVATIDFAVVKETPFGEGRSVQFRTEMFNLPNRANFSSPNSGIFNNTTGIPSATAGRITSTSTTSRQIQFALKVVF